MVEARGSVLVTAIEGVGTRTEVGGADTGSVAGSGTGVVTSDAGSFNEADPILAGVNDSEAGEILDYRTI